MHDASSFRYQHRRNVLKGELRVCQEQLESACQLLREADAREVPASETLQALLTRAATRGSIVGIIEALEQRTRQLQIAHEALETELRAIWNL